jgi:hypothetical protein
MNKTKTLESSLVLTTGFLLIYLITLNNLFLYLAFAFGITGILFKPLAKYIAIAWFKLADLLSWVVSKAVLGILFFVVLLPVSLLYRITNKDKLQLKRSSDSTWIERNQTYTSGNLKNIW